MNLSPKICNAALAGIFAGTFAMISGVQEAQAAGCLAGRTKLMCQTMLQPPPPTRLLNTQPAIPPARTIATPPPKPLETPEAVLRRQNEADKIAAQRKQQARKDLGKDSIANAAEGVAQRASRVTLAPVQSNLVLKSTRGGVGPQRGIALTRHSLSMARGDINRVITANMPPAQKARLLSIRYKLEQAIGTTSTAALMAGASPRFLRAGDKLNRITFHQGQLSSKAKHAKKYFGVKSEPGRADQQAFRKAIERHVGSPDTFHIRGTYKNSKSSPLEHSVFHVNMQSRVAVRTDLDGRFITAHRLSRMQVQNLVDHGNVGHPAS